MMTANPAAAFAAGLTPRPLRQTVADIRAEARAPGASRPDVGISADREAELLARWAAAPR
jgi:2'-hydroxyisoflavone reductase